VKKFQVKREKIIEAATEFVGTRFLHQGRDKAGVDCVGLLVAVGRAIGYPEIFDVEGYRRVPSADTIRETLRKNCDEIEVSEVKPGDIFLMRMGGIKPRHAAIFLGDVWHGEPAMVHAVAPVVKVQPLSDFPSSWFVCGFRIKGVKG
jgi:cell wall-associated NlpC family hydrolase